MSTNNKLFELYNGLESDLATLIGPIKFSAEINLRLERITHLLSLLGDPHLEFPSIHVGGTSGKGSTATMIATILTEAGYKTGLHLSPHLQIINERHQINNIVVPTTRLVELFAEVKQAIKQVDAENPFGAPSYFEAQVALAFLYFQREAVDIAVIEVGLGGAIDATNVIKAQVGVLTNVGLDHTAILGDTVEEIIQDKAGIIKPGQMVISGVEQPGPRQIVAERCQANNARLWQLGRDFTCKAHGDSCFSVTLPSRTLSNIELDMGGDFQISNGACAVAAVEALSGFEISEAAIRRGLAKAHIPGRMEVVQQSPLVILDGAHNPEKIRAARQVIDADYQDRHCTVVLSLKSDKSAEDVLPHVLRGAKKLILTEFRVKGLWEPMSPETLADLSRKIAPDLEIQIVHDPIKAVELALANAEANDLIWITGSLYLVGDVRQYWCPISTLLAQAEIGLPGSLLF